VRLTSDGKVYLAGLVAATFVALAGSNNLLIGLVSVGWTALLLEPLVGRLNLARLQATRTLPVDLFACTPAVAEVALGNPTPWTTLALRVDGSEEAVDVAPRGSSTVMLPLLPPKRGARLVGPVMVRSSFPFGWVVHERVLSAGSEVLVFPQPGMAGEAHTAEGSEEGALPSHGTGEGDFRGLRAYRPGDPMRQIHWRTTARVGQTMVVQRGATAIQHLEVVVCRVSPDLWEGEISAATKRCLDSLERDVPVGLSLPRGGDTSERIAPGTGPAHRRVLLAALARLPEVPP
jgi:uncharacterized protein (DUF58 family)